MKKTLSMLVGLLFLISATALAENAQFEKFYKQQNKKRDGFSMLQIRKSKKLDKSLKGKTQAEIKAEKNRFRENRYKESVAFNEKIHKENMAFLKKQLARNNKLTNAQREERLNHMELQYQKKTALIEQYRKERIAFKDKMDNNDSLTPEQKAEALQDYNKEQEVKIRQYYEEYWLNMKSALEN